MKKSFIASEIIIHPEYHSETYAKRNAYDVAILKERYEVSYITYKVPCLFSNRNKFNESIITNQAADFACLHNANDHLEEGTVCYTAGWGWNTDWYGYLYEVCFFFSKTKITKNKDRCENRIR